MTHTDAGHINGYDPACEDCNKAHDRHRLAYVQADAIRQFLWWMRERGWTPMAHNGINSFVPDEIYDDVLARAGGPAWSTEKVHLLFRRRDTAQPEAEARPAKVILELPGASAKDAEAFGLWLQMRLDNEREDGNLTAAIGRLTVEGP